MLISLISFFYKNITRRIFFRFDPEFVHNIIVNRAELIGKTPAIKLMNHLFAKKSKILHQKIAGIDFDSPLGLAAGFDYEARLTQVLPHLGFGFQAIGTITNHPYKGNPRPLLGRLPKSKSLMVNKGFKNMGARWTAEKLANQDFQIPLGISIGQTNQRDKKIERSEIRRRRTAIADILQAFTAFKKANIKNAYYELNISCPNLYGNITFYPPENLDELLSAVDKLNLKKPIFIKMPINESDSRVLEMLEVITHHKIAGVIFGNLQKDRNNPAIVKSEIKWEVGNFSGKPTWNRSNELIFLAYKKYRNKLVIIGCGGVFSTTDAYRKIKLGASLVQLITGLIYEGPLLVAKINKELPKLLEKDGFEHVSQAIGIDTLNN